MTPWLKTELACITILGSLFTCSHGLSLDFSKLSFYRHPFLKTHKRSGTTCDMNPCESSKPFLCRNGQKCVALKFVCDGTWDCDDGFDEEPAVCNAAVRPSYDDLYYFVENEANWMIPKLFNGASPDIIAHALTVAADLDDLSMTIGLTDENVEALHQAFEGAIEGDERPLLKLGMPERSWHEVQFVLQKLLDSGFKI